MYQKIDIQRYNVKKGSLCVCVCVYKSLGENFNSRWYRVRGGYALPPLLLILSIILNWFQGAYTLYKKILKIKTLR